MCIKLKKSATKNHEILLSDFFGEYSLDKTQAFEYKLARLKDGWILVLRWWAFGIERLVYPSMTTVEKRPFSSLTWVKLVTESDRRYKLGNLSLLTGKKQVSNKKNNHIYYSIMKFNNDSHIIVFSLETTLRFKSDNFMCNVFSGRRWSLTLHLLPFLWLWTNSPPPLSPWCDVTLSQSFYRLASKDWKTN